MPVVGACDATGGEVTKGFARGGLIACVTRRTADGLEPLIERIRAEGGEAQDFASDASKEVDVETPVAHVEREIDPSRWQS